MGRAVVQVGVVGATGVGIAALIAFLRHEPFGDLFLPCLWLIGALIMLLALFSLSPSTRAAQDTLNRPFLGRSFRGSRRETGAGVLGLTATLILGAMCVFALALLVDSFGA